MRRLDELQEKDRQLVRERAEMHPSSLLTALTVLRRIEAKLPGNCRVSMMASERKDALAIHATDGKYVFWREFTRLELLQVTGPSDELLITNFCRRFNGGKEASKC